MGVHPQAIAPNPHTNLLNVYIQIANKMGFKKFKKCRILLDGQVARQELSILVLAATNTQTRTDELLEAEFSIRSVSYQSKVCQYVYPLYRS
jgi:hypothetical protein